MPAVSAADLSLRIDPPPGVDDDAWLAALEEWWVRDDHVLRDRETGTAVGLITNVEISRGHRRLVEADLIGSYRGGHLRPCPPEFLLRLRVDRAYLDRLATISYVQEGIVVGSKRSFVDVAPPVSRAGRMGVAQASRESDESAWKRLHLNRWT